MSILLNAEAATRSQGSSSILPYLGGIWLISMVIAASIPGTAQAGIAGTVDFSNGTAMVFDSSGKRESLSKGMQLTEGDTIRTGASGLAQIRFTDGAYVSIQKDTIFKIDEYSYNAQGDNNRNSNKGFFSLVKGGFRAITGFLGAKNYQVRTPVATIGIRGTEYFAEYGRSLTFSVADGAIEVCNTGGCQFFRENELGNIKGNASLIQRLNDTGLDVVVSDAKDQTTATVEAEEEFIFRITEEITEDGDLQVFEESVPNCSTMNCNAAFAWFDPMMSNYVVQSITDVAAEFNNGALFVHNGGAGTNPDNVDSGIAQPGGATSEIAWGRWIGGPSAAGLSEVHYVIGVPTPNINTLTGTISFAVSGWSTPTSTIANLGEFNGINGNMITNFDSGEVNVQFTTEYDNGYYDMSSMTPLIIDTDANFSSSAMMVNGGVMTPGPSCIGTGCSGSISGFFAGETASSAGLSYHIKDNVHGDIIGAVVFGGAGQNTVEVE